MTTSPLTEVEAAEKAWVGACYGLVCMVRHVLQCHEHDHGGGVPEWLRRELLLVDAAEKKLCEAELREREGKK